MVMGFASVSFADNDGKDLWQSMCSGCHSPNLVKRHKNYSVNDWMKVIDRMKSAGLKISADQQKAIAQYLNQNIK
ncbi:MAG: cytochrome c [Deferribacterales bacterium]|nr:cytochrome c [Deferribacterales bacterium]